MEAGELTQLGSSGRPHYDAFDDPLSFTSLREFSDIPPNYDPGGMFLNSVQCFTRLDKNRCLHFSGLNKHAGSSAKAPPGEPVDPRSNRAAYVHYRQRAAANAHCMKPLAARPDNKDAFYTTPEMHFPE